MSSLMKQIKLTLIFWFAIFLPACAVEPKPENKNIIEIPEGLVETLYGVDIKADSLWFLVKSNGCTTAKSFRLVTEKLVDGQVSVTLKRERRDLCRGLTRLVGIDVPYKHVANTQVVITNPFSMKPIRKKQ